MDHTAASPADQRVIDAMLSFMRKPGNPSSMHSAGFGAMKAISEARKRVAALIGAAKPDEIIFTSGATESINLALRGAAQRYREKGDHIITSKIEHMSVMNTCKALEKDGFKISYLPVDRHGMVSPADLRSAITDKTILVSLSYANGEVGTIQPVKEFGAITRERKVLLHIDGTAAAGKIPINVVSDNVDMLSMSSNDICGPQGVGALYLRSGVRVLPQSLGGGQEKGLRSGTENVAGIVGFGEAAQIARKEMPAESERLMKLRDRLIVQLMRIDKAYLNGHPQDRLPNNVNVRFMYVEGESILLNLDMVGIEAATSSACTSKTLEPSHVLLAMGVSHADSQGALLLTLGKDNTEEDVEYVASKVPAVIERLRAMSPIAAHPELLDVAYDKDDEGHGDEE
jgi:cysteine desulfurase